MCLLGSNSTPVTVKGTETTNCCPLEVLSITTSCITPPAPVKQFVMAFQKKDTLASD